METMRAAEYDRFGPAEVLEVRTVPVPRPGPGQVLVRVAAASVNPKDSFVRKGRFALYSGRRFPRRTGYDFAGTVAAPGTSGLADGDAVWSMLNGWAGGACADFVAVPLAELAPKPPSLTMEQAAALPLVALTALQALRDDGDLEPGQNVLLHGASGGVGTAAVQIAAALGARITATCSAANAALVRSLGAAEVVDYRERPAATLPGPFDLVFDIFGDLSLGKVRHMLAPRGRYVTTVPKARNLIDVALTRLRPGPRAALVVVRSNRPDLELLGRMVEEGKLRPVIDRIYPLDAIADAHRHVEGKRSRGKVVVTVAD
ncbi:MAG TPA: NAD(P)-dependent alcohol dehydrogenase [Azospirillaceae bacterium]|nr:NAD(P)-dependent alcohol dehydrogenase [Azospirillaceae bacterium]